MMGWHYGQTNPRTRSFDEEGLANVQEKDVPEGSRRQYCLVVKAEEGCCPFLTDIAEAVALAGTLASWLIRGLHCMHAIGSPSRRIGAQCDVEFATPRAITHVSGLLK